ncbi:hypothetical protein TNCV_2006471 [Trichonephila clavipes]|nr:hypothetical protein TNCV_2006471 [Trichonephila clavipes]
MIDLISDRSYAATVLSKTASLLLPLFGTTILLTCLNDSLRFNDLLTTTNSSMPIARYSNRTSWESADLHNASRHESHLNPEADVHRKSGTSCPNRLSYKEK